MLDASHVDKELAAQRVSLLSRREAEVLRTIALGLTNSEVAERLDVSVHAVKFHLASIYRKLGVGNRTEAAVAYLHVDHDPLRSDRHKV